MPETGEDEYIKTRDNNRNSNIEIIRIIAIVLITFNHIYNKGVDKSVILDEYEAVNAAISVFFCMGGKFGCNLFLIISTWFLAEKDIQWRSALKIWIQTVFYTLTLDIISVVFFKADLSKIDLLSIFLPLSFGTYWYSTAYVIMLILGPIFRKQIEKCGKMRPILILVGGIALSIIPTLTLEGTVFGANRYLRLAFKVLTYSPIWFLYTFVLIGYLKDIKVRLPTPKTSLVIAVVMYVGMFLITWILFLGVGSGTIPDTWQFAAFRQLNSPLCLLGAFYLFVAALNTKPTSIRWVNRIAGYSYGIYLFQCHKTFQGILWKEILQFEKYFNASVPAYVLYSVFGVGVIIVLGFLLEWIYKKTFLLLQKMIPILR